MKPSKSIQAEYQALTAEINRHNRLYYEEEAPVISDGEYDELLDRLAVLEQEYPTLAGSHSPLARVGSSASSRFADVLHDPPMLSLDKVTSPGEFDQFHNRCVQALGKEPLYAVQLKYDGLAVELEYRDGLFFRGSTRGNGIQGEDVTENLSGLSSLPRVLSGPAVPAYCAVRGEVFLRHEEFERINAERAEQGEKLFANPRNAASGSLRQLDAAVTASRNLDLAIYGLGKCQGIQEPGTWTELMRFLESLGFPVPRERMTGNREDIIAWFEEWSGRRHELEYDIDGIVVKLDDRSAGKDMGETTRAPRWAVAWKFPSLEASTVLLSVENQVGRTGVVTPVAHLKAVTVGGVVVKRATLHNFSEISRLDAAPGDTVTLVRAGDVIPKITGVVQKGPDHDSNRIQEPAECPVCRSALAREDVYIRCVNRRCPAVFFEKLKYFISREGLDIESFGPELLQRCIDQGLVKDYPDIFSLTLENLLSLERMGEKLAVKILEAIAARKTMELPRFIRSLGIRNVGPHIAEIIARELVTLERVMDAPVEVLSNIDGVGPEVAGSVRTFFDDSETREMIARLLEMGIVITGGREKESSRFQGITFVFTGTLSAMTRDEAEAMVRDHGGRAAGSVSSKTGYCVAGENAGTKVDKARALGISVITENEFLAMVRGE